MRRFAEAGVWMLPAAGSDLVIMPPLTIGDDEAERLAAVCVDVLTRFTPAAGRRGSLRVCTRVETSGRPDARSRPSHGR